MPFDLLTAAVLLAVTQSSFGSRVNPDRMPGDDVPPPLNLQLRESTADATPDPVDTTAGPPLALALVAAQTAMATCEAQGHRIGVAVLDSSGNLRLGLQGDGAKAGRIYFASRKALAALMFDAPSSAVQTRLRETPSDRSSLKPNMVAVPGAVPLHAGGRVIGAVGASGATGEQDERCAAAGAAAISARLG